MRSKIKVVCQWEVPFPSCNLNFLIFFLMNVFAVVVIILVPVGHAGSIAAVIKSKTTGLETCNMLNKIAQTCTPNLATQYEIYKMQIGFT